jgi:menaquinone-dependent protoporphyrinogen oxidase
MPPRVLLLFGTTDGHTGKVATAISNTLRAEGAEVDVVHARSGGPDPNPEDYAAVIVAASVHASGYQRAVWRWARAHSSTLAGKPTAFVSVCLGILEHTTTSDAELASIMESFFETTRWTPTVRKMVAGALAYTRYSWLKRLVVRRIVRHAYGHTDASRDYEYTDWNDVREFSRMFVRLVFSSAGTPAPRLARAARGAPSPHSAHARTESAL